MMEESEVRNIGLDCLIECLGFADAVRFINDGNAQAGDYTVERRAYIDNLTREEIAEGIKKDREKYPITPEFIARMEANARRYEEYQRLHAKS